MEKSVFLEFQEEVRWFQNDASTSFACILLSAHEVRLPVTLSAIFPDPNEQSYPENPKK